MPKSNRLSGNVDIKRPIREWYNQKDYKGSDTQTASIYTATAQIDGAV